GHQGPAADRGRRAGSGPRGRRRRDRGTMTTSTGASDNEESWPSGRGLRRLTRAATEAHTGGHMGELVSEVYSVLFSAGVAVVMVLGAMQGLNATLQPGP